MGALRWAVAVLVWMGMLHAKAQRSQEFLVTFVDGRTYSYVLPADWEPEVRRGQLVLTPAMRVWAMDVAAIRPFVTDDVSTLHRIKLLPRSPRVGRAALELWVEYDPLGPGMPIDPATGFVHAGPGTWVRPELFRMTLE